MNKYQESLDWIKYDLSRNYAADKWFEKKNECLDTLQELIDNYQTFYEGAMKISAKNMKLENALDKACQMIVDNVVEGDADKEQIKNAWKERFLKNG